VGLIKNLNFLPQFALTFAVTNHFDFRSPLSSAMVIHAMECTLLTRLATDVRVNVIDTHGMSISGNGVTHTIFHAENRFFSLIALQTRYRFILKQLIKRVSTFVHLLSLLLFLGDIPS
jgi:hypothetical protein